MQHTTMASSRTLKSHFLYSILKHQKASFSDGVDSAIHSPLSRTSFSSNAHLVSSEEGTENKKSKGVTSLVEVFKYATGLTERGENESSEDELNELNKKLREIEEEVRHVRGNLNDAPKKKKASKKKNPAVVEPQVTGLYSLFKTPPKTSPSMLNNCKEEEKPVKELSLLSSMFTAQPKASHSLLLKNKDCEEDKTDVSAQQQGGSSVKSKPIKKLLPNQTLVSEQKQGRSSVQLKLKPMEELLPEVILLTRHLHEKGYLKDANFLNSEELDLRRFKTFYSRSYLSNAAQRLGKDHQEMAKFLSKSDVEKIALFGCPSVEKDTAYAAKRIRAIFDIKEGTVCGSCKLNSLCKLKDRTSGKFDDRELRDVMKILTMYALDLVHPQLTVPDDVKHSISVLLRQAVEHFQKFAT